MSLDHSIARIFDQEPMRVGSGWLSGTMSIFLGAIGLGAVACFYFPELLTSPDVRARLPMPIVRTTLQLVIGFAFLLGVLSTMLRRRKVLGATGMALALVSSLAGGGNVPVEGVVQSTPMYLGLDWFLINVLLLTVLFVPMERFWPLRHLGQSGPGWVSGAAHVSRYEQIAR